MPVSMATTKIAAGSKPAPKATIAGPGQKPARPQPVPNTRLPPINRASTSRRCGSLSAPPRKSRCPLARESEGEEADKDCSRHHEGERRVPAAGHIQEADHFPGIRHAGDKEAQPEDQAPRRKRSGCPCVPDEEYGGHAG